MHRFYKSADKIGQVLHIGTVIEGPSEYKSARMTNRERKQSIVEEILADQSIKNYTKRKFLEISERASKTSFKGKKQLKKSAKKAKKVKALF